MPSYSWLESLDTDELIKSKDVVDWLTANPEIRDDLYARHSRYHLMHYIKKCHVKILKRKEKQVIFVLNFCTSIVLWMLRLEYEVLWLIYAMAFNGKISWRSLLVFLCTAIQLLVPCCGLIILSSCSLVMIMIYDLWVCTYARLVMTLFTCTSILL